MLFCDPLFTAVARGAAPIADVSLLERLEGLRSSGAPGSH